MGYGWGGAGSIRPVGRTGRGDRDHTQEHVHAIFIAQLRTKYRHKRGSFKLTGIEGPSVA